MNYNETSNSPIVRDYLFSAENGFLSGLTVMIPRILIAVLIFMLGLLLAKWTKSLIVSFVRSMKMNVWLEHMGVEKFLKQADISSKVEEIIGVCVSWLVTFLAVIVAVDFLGLPAVSGMLTMFLSFIPKVLSAVFVLAIGVFLAGFVEKFVKGAISQVDIRVGRLMGKISSYIVVIFASMAALTEIGIAKDLINIMFLGFVSMLALGFGLALGLGAKDIVNKVLTDWYHHVIEELKTSEKSESEEK